MSRRLVVDACCFVHCSTWLEAGWEQLAIMANFQGDYLLPAPATHFHGCRKKELGYDQAFALKVGGQPLLHTSLWENVHVQLHRSTELREIRPVLPWRLGSTGHRYMQRSVAEALRASQDDTLGEGETLQQYDEYLHQQGVDDESRRKSPILLDSTGRAISYLPPQAKESNPPEVQEHVDLVLPEEDGDPENTAPKKRQHHHQDRNFGFQPQTSKVENQRNT